jgi:hypothetical protein
MDGFEQVSAEAGSGQNDSSSASEASPNGSATDVTFLARADQWREEALRHPDDRQACIGAVNAGLARVVHAHQMAIERRIENCETPLLEDSSIRSAIPAHNGLLRQWHSMMSFQARLEQIRLDAGKQEAERQADPLLRTPR